MKKWLGVILLGVVFVLAGCKSYVTPEDLKANDWIIEAAKEDAKGTPDMIATFSDHVMTLKVDTSSIESTAKNGWEALGEELGKQIAGQVNITYEYTLNKDEIKLQLTDDKDKDVYYKVTKKDDNIIFTPDKDKNDDDDEGKKMTLKPYKKIKDKNSSESSESTESSTKEKEIASTDDYIKKFEDKKLVVYNKRKMTKDDFGMAPATAKEAVIFSLIETDNEDDQKNARLLTFDNLEDLNETKKYYDDLGKGSAMLFSYTAADEDNLVLMQFNGDFDQKLVEKYTDTASLKLTEPPFDTTKKNESSTSEDVQSDAAAYSEEIYQTPEVENQTEPSQSTQQQNQEVAENEPTRQTQSPEPAEEQYITVQNGEGPPQVAARAGISVDQLYQLNGIDPNNFLLYPGQQLRVK
ncbi:LysM peptidoglycan-binding domain-containing protein [Enterococcus dispar]|uniref:LysM peptidoglycan-binding domain-containing protein n=1 Tax=Enterococcus dispar TaxID=44009 RepID=UPI00232CBDEC|nr:LysM peptidoglycan-binding domain-containing protein [Enterococcus dispar]WCG33964.1 LysM peptidoglycan-binding domain-containing protein [Enterococcus dispar]